MLITPRFGGFGAVAAMTGALSAAPAHADVVISSAQTQNISCTNGVCAPTATNAVLNVGDLETYLASGNIEVTTTGSGVEADNIDVQAPFSWSNANTLALQAYDSIAIAQHISVKAQGGLSIVTNNGGSGGTFSTGPKGRISFANLSSPLTINRLSYTLANSLKSLISAFNKGECGHCALIDNYDASQDSTYSNTPITTYLYGTVEGLGNTISNVHVNIAKGTQFNVGGLFLVVEFGAKVENLALSALDLQMAPYERGVSQNAGGFTVTNKGLLFNDHVSGKIVVDAKRSGAGSSVGGLVSENYGGTTSNSSSTAQIGIANGDPGGLVSANVLGTIVESYATGSVKGTDESGETALGGLVSGTDAGNISNSYATGPVDGHGQAPEVGGFLGSDSGTDSNSTSYSTGQVIGGGGPTGGFIGQDSGGGFSDCYWDTTTSGTSNGTGEGNVSGITGLTTKQFKSGLPTGFDPTIWARDKKINHGFPYLIANPPRD